MKLRSLCIALAVLLVLVVVILVVPRYLNPAQPPNSATGATLDTRTWLDYVPEDGSYSVTMPGKPVVSVKVGESALAGKVSIRYAILELPSDKVHFVTYYHQIPPAVKADDMEGLLDSMAKSYVRQTKTEVIASRRITQDGVEGMAMLLFSPTTGEINRQIVRFFVAKNHAYFNIVATNDERENEPFVSRFLDSFKLQK